MIDLLKLLLILALTIFLLFKKWDLGLILLLNSVLAAVLFAYPLRSLPLSMWRGVSHKDTLNLALAVFLVLLLAELLHRTRSMEAMVQSLQELVPDSRLLVALLPMLIGLMPMLGGAMFSAPMVNEIGTRLKLNADRKTFINYWFRHTMEYVFPLYSSLLMISALVGISVYDFIRVSWPLTFVAIAGGVVWGLVGIPRQQHASNGKSKGRVWKELFASTWPLLLVILTVVILQTAMIPTLLVVVALVLLSHRIGPRQWRDVLTRSFPVPTFSAIFGVMIFKRVLEDAGAIQTIPQTLSALGLPALLVAFLIPMLIGLLTGVAAATSALSVPLVLPLLTAAGLDTASAGVWLFVGGFSGVLLSPMHLCLSLTRAYFKANWGGLYKAIVPSVALVVAAALMIVM